MAHETRDVRYQFSQAQLVASTTELDGGRRTRRERCGRLHDHPGRGRANRARLGLEETGCTFGRHQEGREVDRRSRGGLGLSRLTADDLILAGRTGAILPASHDHRGAGQVTGAHDRDDGQQEHTCPHQNPDPCSGVHQHNAGYARHRHRANPARLPLSRSQRAWPGDHRTMIARPPGHSRPNWPDWIRSTRTFHSSFARTAVLASSPMRTWSPSMTTSGHWSQDGQSETARVSIRHLPSPSVRCAGRRPPDGRGPCSRTSAPALSAVAGIGCQHRQVRARRGAFALALHDGDAQLLSRSARRLTPLRYASSPIR